MGKSEYRKGYDEGHDDATNEFSPAEFFVGMFMGALVLFMTLGICGVFASPMERLDLDKTSLIKSHVVEYYPEYKDCRLEFIDASYVDCVYGVHGVKVFCEEPGDRDGMSILGTNEDLVICLDDVEIKDIFEKILEDYR